MITNRVFDASIDKDECGNRCEMNDSSYNFWSFLKEGINGTSRWDKKDMMDKAVVKPGFFMCKC